MNKRESFRKYQQRGFTLLELGIVVTIALVLIGVGVTKVPKIMADNRANAEISELPQIVAKIQKAVANQQNYTGMTLDSLIRLDVFPQNR
ncbi:MAG TPA: prepilin-type N-terminal cleavage/methylation domain-containing protein, partial [Noviherbaspirillum sp.]